VLFPIAAGVAPAPAFSEAQSMTATRTRKPITRMCRLDGALLYLTVGKKSYIYQLEPLDTDFGLGFRLRKQESEYAGGPEVETEVYDVNLDLADRQHICSCPGALYHHHCKHIDSLLALHVAGKLDAARDSIRAAKARHVHPLALRIAALELGR
jgi:hypothetical protein